MSMSDQYIAVDVAPDGVATLTINRPPVNAMSSPVRVEFVAAVDGLQDRDDVRAIVLTGAGSIFSAGADIKEKSALAAKGSSASRSADRLTHSSFFCLLDSTKPVVAAVNGAALGAGFVMAACCDIIVAAESAFFAMPEVDVGQAGGASFLQRIVPQQALRYMLLTAARVPAQELYRLGAVHRCVRDEEVLSSAREIAAVIAGKSPAAVRATRQSLQPVAELGVRSGFSMEQAYTAVLSTSPEAEEARLAFLRRKR